MGVNLEFLEQRNNQVVGEDQDRLEEIGGDPAEKAIGIECIQQRKTAQYGGNKCDCENRELDFRVGLLVLRALLFTQFPGKAEDDVLQDSQRAERRAIDASEQGGQDDDDEKSDSQNTRTKRDEFQKTGCELEG